MTYLVAICDACRHVSLHPVAGFRTPASFCRCNAVLRAVPSRMFSDNERARFAEVANAVNESALPGGTARALIDNIQRAKTPEERSELWERITDRIPALLSMHLVLGRNETARLANLDMLRAILEAVSTTRDSGEFPAAGVAAGRR